MTRTIIIQNATSTQESVLSQAKHKEIIKSLIACESQGINISKPDSDGIISDGILQYHRGADDKIDSGTWGTFSRKSGIEGDPRAPEDAIRMTDWAIENGLICQWSCAHIKHISGC